MRTVLSILFLHLSSLFATANHEERILRAIDSFDGKAALLDLLNFTPKGPMIELPDNGGYLQGENPFKKKYFGCLAFGDYDTWPYIDIFEGPYTHTLIMSGENDKIIDYLTIKGGRILDARGSNRNKKYILRLDLKGDPSPIVSYEFILTPEVIEQNSVQIYNLKALIVQPVE